MVKGVSIKLTSYSETIPKLFDLIKFSNELKKHERIVLKPSLDVDPVKSTDIKLVEAIVRYCVAHRNAGTELFIAEGCDGADTMEVFESQGYHKLAEHYGLGIVDLNKTDTEAVGNNDFVGFESIMYPSILKSSFIITIPTLREDEKTDIAGSLASMLGAFPAKHYKGLFSSRKNKLDDYPLKYRIHDIIMCKMPDFSVVDAKSKGLILAGNPLEMDKKAASLVGKDWKSISYMRMLEETLSQKKEEKEESLE